MRKRIGEFLLDKGLITQEDVERILQHSNKTGLRFGDAGLDLGVLTRDKLIEVFGPSFAVDFFHLDPKYFPKVTEALLPVDLMLRLGALPLGFKTETSFFRARKMLNIGLLDPARPDAPQECLGIAQSKLGAKEVHGTKVFLVLADQFLQVLREVYGKSEEDLRRMDPNQLDGTLQLFLEHARTAR